MADSCFYNQLLVQIFKHQCLKINKLYNLIIKLVLVAVIGGLL